MRIIIFLILFISSQSFCDSYNYPSSSGGAAGPTGPAGPAGSNGATGASGFTGISGASGASGASGSSGATGATGAGSNGNSGVSGATGASGLNGITGPTGGNGPVPSASAVPYAVASPSVWPSPAPSHVAEALDDLVAIQKTVSTFGIGQLSIDANSSLQIDTPSVNSDYTVGYFTNSGTFLALHGVAGVAGHLCTGSSVGDFCFRTVNSGNIIFATAAAGGNTQLTLSSSSLYTAAGTTLGVATAGPPVQTLEVNGTTQLDGAAIIGAPSTTPQHSLNTATATNAAGVGTITNLPAGFSGNPTGYVQININGTPHIIPYW